MLFARCISNGIKWFCPDVFSGSVYTPEELGATVNEEGDVIDVTTTPRTQAPQPATPPEEPEVDFRAEPEEEVKPTRITDKQRRQFMMLGTSLYGADVWVDKRPELIKWVTGGRATHTNDMTTDEAAKLIKGLDDKVQARDAERAVAA